MDAEAVPEAWIEEDLSLDTTQAQKVIDHHSFSSDRLTISKLVELPNEGYR